MLLLIQILVFKCFGQWLLIDQNDFNVSTLEQLEWSSQSDASISECPTLNEKQITLSQSNSFLEKSFTQDAQVIQIMADVYIDSISTNQQFSNFQIEIIEIYSLNNNVSYSLFNYNIDTSQLQNFSEICDSTYQQTRGFQLISIVSQQLQISSKTFMIRMSLINSNSNISVRIRNFFLYACFLNCTSNNMIVTQQSTQCVSSYYLYPKQFFQLGFGCVEECSRNNYILNKGKTDCVKDSRIFSKYFYLNLTQSGGELLQASNFSNTPQQTIQCETQLQVHGYYKSQRVEINLGILNQNITLIRIRLNVILYLFQSQSKIYFGLDDQIQQYFSLDYTSYILIDIITNSFSSSILTQVDQSNMNACTIKYRLELILLKNYSNINPSIFFLEGNMSNPNSLWGFSNLTVDMAVCKNNCLSCQDIQICSLCNEGYFLYQDECVKNCPIHSIIGLNNNCIDYQDEIPNSKYLVKAFYDLNMTIDQINYHIDSVFNYSINFLTGQYFSVLSNKIVIGGLLVWNNGKYTKTYNISDPHYAISIRFNITFGDNFQGLFKYYIDDFEQAEIARIQSEPDTNIIGLSFSETIQFVYKQLLHTQSSFKVEFECQTNITDITDGFCAVSEYFIVVHKCISYCQLCSDQYSCLNYISSNNTTNSTNSTDYISSNTTNSTNSTSPTNLTDYMSNNTSNSTNFTSPTNSTDYMSNNTTNSTNSTSPTNSTDYMSNNTTNSTNFTSPTNSTDTTISTQPTNNSSSNSTNLSQCLPPYYLFYQQSTNSYTCELCNIEFCFECQTSNQCKSCIQNKNNKFTLIDGQCLCEQKLNREIISNQCQCKHGYEDDSKNSYCQSKCGDSFITQDEECDDGNYNQYDGCYQCLFQCQLECLSCIKGSCHLCKDQYLLQNNQCIYKNFCGDGILNNANEECDDFNNNAHDGCFDCKIESGFMCQNDDKQTQFCKRCNDLNCLICEEINQLQICNKCNQGYYLENNLQCAKCKDICIDCVENDKNCITFNPNLYQIKSCDINKGLHYDFQTQECKFICGDGIISGLETCDDHNQENNDGCNSECQIEKGYLIDTLTNQTLLAPKIQGNYDQSGTNTIIMIKGDHNNQVINCTDTFIRIDNFDQSNFNYSQLEGNEDCQIQIQYYQTIQSSNIIHIFVKYKNQYTKRLLSEQNCLLQEIKIYPKKQIFQNEKQIAQSKQLGKTSLVASTFVIALAPLAAILGGFKYIWYVLDILSWLNNFYFLNVTYPSNVKQLFLQAEWGNIFTFPSISYFNNPDCDYYFQAQKKFSDKGVDPLFFNNIQTVIFFILQVILSKYLCKLIIKFIDYRFNRATQIHNRPRIFNLGLTIFKRTITTHKDEPQIIKQKVPKIFQSLYRKCQQFQKYFIANLLKVIQINFLDLTLAISLQLSNQQKASYSIVSFNIFMAYFSAIVLVLLFINTYQISISHKLKLENKYFKTIYGCFYEEVKTGSSLSMLYSFVNLIRKAAFIISTVYFYEKPIYQTSFCCLSSILNILILIQHNPFENKQQYILNFIPDLNVFIINCLAIIYAFQDTFNKFDDESIENSGWIIVFCIYIAIGIQLSFLLKQLVLDLREIMKELIENCQANKTIIK